MKRLPYDTRVQISQNHWLRPNATGTIVQPPEEDRRKLVGDYSLVKLDEALDGGGITVAGIDGQCLWVDRLWLEQLEA